MGHGHLHKYPSEVNNVYIQLVAIDDPPLIHIDTCFFNKQTMIHIVGNCSGKWMQMDFQQTKQQFPRTSPATMKLVPLRPTGSGSPKASKAPRELLLGPDKTCDDDHVMLYIRSSSTCAHPYIIVQMHTTYIYIFYIICRIY